MRHTPSDLSVFSAYGTGRQKLVAWGVPTLGRVSMRWVSAHYMLAMPTNTTPVHIYCEGKEVGEARNEIIARALGMENAEREVTHVFFLDDDVLPHPYAFKKLFAAERDIISGLYFLKSPVPTPLVFREEGAGTYTWTPGELVECEAHGMGLTLIRTEVFKRLRDETDLGIDSHGYPAWFKTLRDHQILTPDGQPGVVNETEDVYFLKRARALGYQPCVDTSAEAFGWHWDQSTQKAYPLKQWAEYQRTGTFTWDTPSGPVKWGEAA